MAFGLKISSALYWFYNFMRPHNLLSKTLTSLTLQNEMLKYVFCLLIDSLACRFSLRNSNVQKIPNPERVRCYFERFESDNSGTVCVSVGMCKRLRM